MNPEIVALMSGLSGAIIGALASIGTIWVQQYFQSKQDRAKLILEAAIAEYNATCEYAKVMSERNPGMKIATEDLGHYVALYANLIDEVSNPKKITEERWVAAYMRAKELAGAANEAFTERVDVKAKQ